MRKSEQMPDGMNYGRRGRRSGNPDTRAEILAIACRRLVADGYYGVTMRAIAAEAGVDAALISYYFGSKKGLFGAALALSANPPRKAELEWVDSPQAFEHAEVAVRVEHVGMTSFRLGYDIERVLERGNLSGRQPARCDQVAITYVCVQIAGRHSVPIPAGLREALVSDRA
jgi:AcrR family transcriptional regulator